MHDPQQTAPMGRRNGGGAAAACSPSARGRPCRRAAGAAARPGAAAPSGVAERRMRLAQRSAAGQRPGLGSTSRADKVRKDPSGISSYRFQILFIDFHEFLAFPHFTVPGYLPQHILLFAPTKLVNTPRAAIKQTRASPSKQNKI